MERSEGVGGGLRAGEARHRDAWGIEFSRIVAFSDSVFAIAITLLVLQINIPAHPPAGDTLFDEILDTHRDFIAYGISFAVLGKLWLNHRFFAAVERFDPVLMGLNLLYLAWVVLVPFTSEVLGDYGDDATGVILYAAIMAAVTITFQVQIVYAYRKEMIRPELREYERRYVGAANLAVAAVFLSIPVALVSPLAATVMWLLVFVAGGQAVRWARARAERPRCHPEDAEEGLERLAREVHGCRRCPRLVAWRRRWRRTRRAASVASATGGARCRGSNPRARIVLVGLARRPTAPIAPGACSPATARASGCTPRFTARALEPCGLRRRRDDGLRLRGAT